MTMKSIEEVELESKRVFLRADLNVPLNPNREVADDTRIVSVLPTIKYILRKGGRLILASHLGRPKGEKDDRFSLLPVAEKLQDLLDRDVIMAPDCVGDGVRVVSNQLKEGDVLVLENLRFHDGEKSNNPEFAKSLASLADVYVNDAFGTCHRAHASVVGVPSLMEIKCAGMLIRKELRYLKFAVEDPDRPYLAILGGAKVSDKIGVIFKLLGSINMLCIGGGMAYTFLSQMGIEVGASLVEKAKLSLAGDIRAEAERRNVKLILPVDHVIAKKPEKDAESRIVTNDEGIPAGFAGYDIGPKTMRLFEKAIAKAATIVWNGPMGVFEVDRFAEGTRYLANEVASSNALTIIGGGDSVSAVRAAGVADKITHISTGGGASLELLEGKQLPGIVALET